MTALPSALCSAPTTPQPGPATPHQGRRRLKKQHRRPLSPSTWPSGQRIRRSGLGTNQSGRLAPPPMSAATGAGWVKRELAKPHRLVWASVRTEGVCLRGARDGLGRSIYPVGGRKRGSASSFVFLQL
jgi:hypothetical protein